MEHIDPSDFNVTYVPQGSGHPFGAKVDPIPRQGEIVEFAGPLGKQEVVRVTYEQPSGKAKIVLRRL